MDEGTDNGIGSDGGEDVHQVADGKVEAPLSVTVQGWSWMFELQKPGVIKY